MAFFGRTLMESCRSTYAPVSQSRALELSRALLPAFSEAFSLALSLSRSLSFSVAQKRPMVSSRPLPSEKIFSLHLNDWR